MGGGRRADKKEVGSAPVQMSALQKTDFAAHLVGHGVINTMNTPDQLTPKTDEAETALTVALAKWNGALERALKAEADLAALEQCHDDNCRALVKIDAELQRVCEVEQELRAEVKRMTHAYEYDHKCLHEVRERCELWKQRAQKAEAELAKYLSACPASPTEEERKRCQQWWAISGKSQ
jgi:hypothetical protein